MGSSYYQYFKLINMGFKTRVYIIRSFISITSNKYIHLMINFLDGIKIYI